MEYMLIIIIGITIGSFLNVCIYRIPKDESIVFPPSHCVNCKHNLNPFDLIPIISYILIGGKCRYCNARISARYLIIETVNSALYLLIYLKFGLTILMLKYCILASVLIVIGMIDYDTQFIFTKTTVFGGVVGIIFIIVQGIVYNNGTFDLILGGLIGFAIIGLIVSLTKGMGEGDTEIAVVCGLFLGSKGILLGLFLAIVIGGISGIIILALKIKNSRAKMAFGPFIGLGCLISMLWEVEILRSYWSLLM